MKTCTYSKTPDSDICGKPAKYRWKFHERYDEYCCEDHIDIFASDRKDLWIPYAEEIKQSENTVTNLLKERGSVYGDVRDNMNCAKELINVLDKWMSRTGLSVSTEFDEIGWKGCIGMICHKLSRIVTGNVEYEDNYKDIAGYAELARRIVKGEMDANPNRDEPL